MIDQETVTVGGVEKRMSLGSGSDQTDIVFPAGVLATRTALTMRLAKSIAKAGPQPAGPCVQVANKDVAFAAAAQMRQTQSPPPAGMRYMAVHADEEAQSWTAQADARVASVLGGTADGGITAALEATDATASAGAWEIDVRGSGLWAIALVPTSSNNDGGAGDASATDAGDLDSGHDSDDSDRGAADSAPEGGAADSAAEGDASSMAADSGPADSTVDGVAADSAVDGGPADTAANADGAIPSADATATADALDPAMLPQLTQLVPAQGTAGQAVSLEVHGRNITDGWTIVFDGKTIGTKIAPVTLAGVSDGNGAVGSVTPDRAIATGQVPVWLESAGSRSNTLYFNIAPAAGAPTIIDYTPDNALPGSPIAIVGTNFAAEPVTIQDPLGRPVTTQATGTITWVGVTQDRIDIVIPADMPSGVFTVSNSKGSFRGRIFNVGTNLARLAGGTAQSSSQYNTSTWSTTSGWDNNLQTSWFSANYDCATSPSCTSVPYFQVTFASAQPVGRIALRGNREYASGYDFLEGLFEVRGVGDAILWKGAYVLPQPDRDLDIVFPTPIQGAMAVRFTSTADESLEPGFSELEVFGP